MIENALIIAVDDDESILAVLSRMLSGARSFTPFRTAGDFLAKAELKNCDIVFMDIDIAGQDGIELTKRVKSAAPQCDVIMITGDATLDNAMAAIKAGAYDFLTKPFTEEFLRATVDRCLEKRRISAELGLIRAAQDELSAAYSQLKGVERMKEAFLSVIGHELRTPLAKIIGGISALEDLSADDSRRRLLNTVKKGAGELHETIENLILYADSRKEPSPSRCSEVDLNAAALSVRDELLPKAKELGVTLSLREYSGNAVINGEQGRILAALRHLLLNAIRFSERGGSVEISVDRSAAFTSVTVKDTGIGIPAELLSGLGNPFYQIADYLTRKTGGLGLGLAIVKNVAEAHHGGVTVKSVQGEGTLFTMTFGDLPQRTGKDGEL